jgi:hypothetical protein
MPACLVADAVPSHRTKGQRKEFEIMPTESQINANRENAKLSFGPKTEEGLESLYGVRAKPSRLLFCKTNPNPPSHTRKDRTRKSRSSNSNPI